MDRLTQKIKQDNGDEHYLVKYNGGKLLIGFDFVIRLAEYEDLEVKPKDLKIIIEEYKKDTEVMANMAREITAMQCKYARLESDYNQLNNRCQRAEQQLFIKGVKE